jgi:acyl-CoA reductase-like NAD-dependent aldehyde dehydrogenase
MATALTPLDAIDSVNPATCEVMARFARTALSSVPTIVGNARAAQRKWAAQPVRERSALLRTLCATLLARRAELAGAVVLETGKPRVEALFADVFVALDSAEYCARAAARLLRPERVPHHSTAAKAKSGRLVCEPLGVLGIIGSWNYPLAIPLSQIIPAVAAGNAVVCKTSEFTPRCGALIGSLFVEAGFPENLVTILQGGPETGEALIDAKPDKIFFTGSVATGRRVAEACARRLIPSVLELGGKDAMLVLADADLEAASSAAVWGSYTNCGQVCLSVERIFVEQSVAEEFTRFCVEKTRKLRVGPGSDPQTDVGPLIRPQHVQRMRDILDDAAEKGAQILCGGKARPDLGPSFFEPAVVTKVDSSMRLFQEETFGPVLAIQAVRDSAEAVTRANDSHFGLAASVWTADKRRGEQIARQLRAGAVMINDAISYFAIAEAPHGGCALSGWGRTHGKAGLLEMVQPKYIDTDRMPGREKPWWYRYGPDLERAADSFLQFEFAPGLARKLLNARSALRGLFRNHGLR